MMMPQAMRMMQPTDRRHYVTKLLQRLKCVGKLIPLASFGDLPIQRVDAIGNVHEDTSRWPWRLFRTP